MYHKEIIVALVYTCGVIVGPFSLYQGTLTTPHILVTIQFAVLAFSNLLLFSYFEMEIDLHQNFGSLPRSIGKSTARSLVMGLLLFVMLTVLVCWLTCPEQDVIKNSQWIILLMSFSLMAIYKWSEFFRQHDRYRFLGDGIFFIPVLVL
jgi:4-hydroxybenzoate polyprenyltransferase